MCVLKAVKLLKLSSYFSDSFERFGFWIIELSGEDSLIEVFDVKLKGRMFSFCGISDNPEATDIRLRSRTILSPTFR